MLWVALWFPVFMRFKSIFTGFRNRLIAGIFVATPLVATIWLLTVAYKFIAGVSAGPIATILEELDQDPAILDQMKWLPFLVTVLVLFLLGLLATNVFGKKLIEWMEAGILRIPVAATIYTGVKQIMDSVSQFRGNMQFKRVAYVQYPSDECRLLGFVTGQFYDDAREEEMTCIFIPTSPNPMTGFVIVVPNRKVMEANLTMEQASKLILSAGLVGPRFPMPAEAEGRGSAGTRRSPDVHEPEEEEMAAQGPPLPHAVRAAQQSSAPNAKAKRDALFRRRSSAPRAQKTPPETEPETDEMPEQDDLDHPSPEEEPSQPPTAEMEEAQQTEKVGR